MSITPDQLAEMSQREFGRIGERFDKIEHRLDAVEHELHTLDASVRNGFNDLAERFGELNDNLSKTLMLWDRRFSDHRLTVDTKLRTFEKSLPSK